MKTQLRSVTLFKLKDFQPQRNRPKKPTKAGRKIQRHAKKWGDLSKKSNTSPQAGNGDKSAPGLLLTEQNTSKNNFCMRNDSGDFFSGIFGRFFLMENAGVHHGEWPVQVHTDVIQWVKTAPSANHVLTPPLHKPSTFTLHKIFTPTSQNLLVLTQENYAERPREIQGNKKITRQWHFCHLQQHT